LKRNKILWIVIVGLMVYEMCLMMFWLGTWIFGSYSLVTLSLPIVTCTLIAFTKQRKLLWIAAVPTTISFIIWTVDENFQDTEGWAVIFSNAKIISAYLCVTLAYLCVFIGKKIKNKKGEDTSC